MLGVAGLPTRFYSRELLFQSLNRNTTREFPFYFDQNLISIMEKRVMMGNLLRLQEYNRLKNYPGLPMDPSRRAFCPNCNKHYSCKSALNRHLKLECGKEPQFKCPECPRRYTQRSSLMSHLKKFHCRENLWVQCVQISTKLVLELPSTNIHPSYPHCFIQIFCNANF